ncbi:putative small nuclear ribonucleoprotein [Cryptosporidium felis]|nr:putative small nuclear ribonucleoprotein [Cryptosporidium felis]
MQKYINYRVKVTVQDDRVMVGNLMAFDRHMNLVLSDCQEYRRIKKGDESKELKRSLGLIMLRGENIVTFVAEAPPKNQSTRPPDQNQMGNIQMVSRGPPLIPPPAVPSGQFSLVNPAIGGLPIPPPGVPPLPPNFQGK